MEIKNEQKSQLQQIRISNLSTIMYERFGGRQLSLAAAIGAKQSYMSLLLSGSRSFGDAKAREIEKALGLPSMWLDETTHHDNFVRLTDLEMRMVNYFRLVPLDAQMELLDAALSVVEQYNDLSSVK